MDLVLVFLQFGQLGVDLVNAFFFFLDFLGGASFLVASVQVVVVVWRSSFVVVMFFRSVVMTPMVLQLINRLLSKAV